MLVWSLWSNWRNVIKVEPPSFLKPLALVQVLCIIVNIYFVFRAKQRRAVFTERDLSRDVVTTIDENSTTTTTTQPHRAKISCNGFGYVLIRI